jgi:hypothetical protein
MRQVQFFAFEKHLKFRVLDEARKAKAGDHLVLEGTEQLIIGSVSAAMQPPTQALRM